MANDNQLHFVTGSTGFLGSYLLRLLVKQGKKVRALKRSTSPMELVQDIAEQVEWVEGDILDVCFLEEAMQGVTHIYHAAAMVSFVPKEADAMMKINITGTANIVNTALAEGVTKLVHVSSISSLGRFENQPHITEKSSWQSSKLNTNYAVSKFNAECEVWRGMEEGLAAVIVNPSIILGSGFWDIGSCNLFKKVWNNLKYYPSGASGFVDVRDVVQVMVQLMESDIQSERFILNSANLSFQHFFNQVAKELGKKAPSIAANSFLRALAWRGEWLRSKLTGHRPIITKETARTSSYSFTYENAKIKKALGFEFIPIEKTIAQTAEQLKTSLPQGHAYAILP